MARRLTAALACALLLAGCGGGGEEPVRFLVFGEPEELKAFRAVVAAYAEERPDEPVQLVEATERSDLITRLSTSLAAGRPPDVFVMNYRYYGQFASKGAIEPIEERLAASGVFEPDDFYPEALEAFRWQGEQLCLPQNVSSLVVYYNRDLFRRAGLPDPQPGWTWNELISIAARLTTDEAGNPVASSDPDQGGGAPPSVYGLGVEPTLIRIAPLVWSNGGELVDDVDRPTRFALETPEAIAALDAFFALRPVIPPDVEVEAEDDESRFANGRLAMILSSRRATPTFRTITDFEWDVAPLPVLREPAGILHSDAYCITSASERKDAAWRFVEFALSEEGQRITARTGRTVPSLISVSREDVFLDPSKPPANSEVFLDGVQTIRRVPSISTWPEIEDAAEPILENGLYLGRSAREVARQLDEATRPLFARAEGS
ncbi:MAG TPA: sugar ABC transporter substrate-binding protein [Gaiellaceae bacterium]|nr:sugar ABC transporter substrate-binding protein [Gaiellaceae bacterium]